jgi:Family of unknown function (DUF6441)
MKLAGTIVRSLQSGIQAELRDIEHAVTSGTRDAGRGLRTELRRQVGSAGLGQRLANSWRDRHYPNQKLDAASLVYTKAPQIIRAFDEGTAIRSRRGASSRSRPRTHHGRAPMTAGSCRAPSRSTASGRSGSSLGRADHRSWWCTDCAPRTAGKPDNCEGSGAQPIGPGAAGRD